MIRDLNPTKRQLERLIMLYFILLVLEGALRKWVLPGLSTPLLIIRDPVALAILTIAVFSREYTVLNSFSLLLFFTTSVAVLTTLAYGHGNLYLAMFGARITLLHLPVLFVIAQVLDRESVEKIGKVILWISPLMLIIIAGQFFSPQSSLINRGVGGDASGSGFSGALGYFRPSGTFSFTNGTTHFFSLAVTFVLYFWSVNRERISRLLLAVATVSVLSAIPLTISRAYLFQCTLAFFVFLLLSVKNEVGIKRLIVTSVVLPVMLLVLSNVSFVQTGIEVFFARFNAASVSEGGLEGTIIERFLGGMIKAITNSLDKPFWGYGLGMGSNFGSVLLSGGRAFLIAEEEWAKVIGESGPLLGITFILLRFFLIIKLGFLAVRSALGDNPLPLFLISYGGVAMIQQNLSQPTALGFVVLSVGLIGGSFNKTRSDPQLGETKVSDLKNIIA